ncbi:sensor histidine kinase [Fictibacillus sp. KU28468]|uniref:sensor histidine kinase n=1 Tax=Fictibacillus sp. KU28468 TaxID=2991053 RepID=UPI00223D3B32|nr:sensor histidine kinase [Fictibacillus sp. KU28468]UZJ77644.1 sensor histidine kinase [Fictibacillus sp. KU28468]
MLGNIVFGFQKTTWKICANNILLDNAMKHTGQGDQILLSAKKAASSIDLMVKDNGHGIAESERERIFDRFYQSDKARTDAEGLGLVYPSHNGSSKSITER